jgi:hypothetical protein
VTIERCSGGEPDSPPAMMPAGGGRNTVALDAAASGGR